MWQETRTDWEPSDSFLLTDYNRICGNTQELRQLVAELYYPAVQLVAPEQYTHGSLIYLEFFAVVEDNLERLWQGSYPRAHYVKRTLTVGGTVWDWHDLRRIEGTLGSMRQDLLRQRAARRVMPISLGGGL